MVDEYILENNGLSFVYLKNGKVHREIGSAMFYIQDKHLYEFEIDKHLYKEQKVDFSLYIEIAMNEGECSIFQKYYLDGIEYSKIEFQKLKPILDLKNQLNNELPVIQSNNKKLKV